MARDLTVKKIFLIALTEENLVAFYISGKEKIWKAIIQNPEAIRKTLDQYDYIKKNFHDISNHQ